MELQCLYTAPPTSQCALAGGRLDVLLCARQASSPSRREDDGTVWGCDSAKNNLGASEAESGAAGRGLSRDAHRIGRPHETSSSQLSVGGRD